VIHHLGLLLLRGTGIILLDALDHSRNAVGVGRLGRHYEIRFHLVIRQIRIPIATLSLLNLELVAQEVQSLFRDVDTPAGETHT